MFVVQCACWHSGDGRVCSVDSDGDGYTDHVASPLCAAGGSQPYCSQVGLLQDYTVVIAYALHG